MTEINDPNVSMTIIIDSDNKSAGTFIMTTPNSILNTSNSGCNPVGFVWNQKWVKGHRTL